MIVKIHEIDWLTYVAIASSTTDMIIIIIIMISLVSKGNMKL